MDAFIYSLYPKPHFAESRCKPFETDDARWRISMWCCPISIHCFLISSYGCVYVWFEILLPFSGISMHAIRNGRRKMEDRHVVLPYLTTLFPNLQVWTCLYIMVCIQSPFCGISMHAIRNGRRKMEDRHVVLPYLTTLFPDLQVWKNKCII